MNKCKSALSGMGLLGTKGSMEPCLISSLHKKVIFLENDYSA